MLSSQENAEAELEYEEYERIPKPRGRPRKGKEWDDRRGCWVAETGTVDHRTTIVVKGNTTHNDGYETPLKEVIAEQQQIGSRKADALSPATIWLATTGQGTGAGSSVREDLKGTGAEGGGRARRKRTHVEYAEDAQDAQAVRRAAAEEARRRRTQGHTGVRVGRKFQAEVPEWTHGIDVMAPGPPPDRNDELQLAHLRHG